MEISKELRIELFNDRTNIKSVDVDYGSDSTMSGFVTGVTPMPFQVILSPHSVAHGEEDYGHSIDFDRALKITLSYRDGSSRVFE